MSISISDFLDRSRDISEFCSGQMICEPKKHVSEVQTLAFMHSLTKAFTEGQVRAKIIQFGLRLIICHRFKELEAKQLQFVSIL